MGNHYVFVVSLSLLIGGRTTDIGFMYSMWFQQCWQIPYSLNISWGNIFEGEPNFALKELFVIKCSLIVQQN